MAHYAFIDHQNIVVEVIVGRHEDELLDGLRPEEWYENFRGLRCIRTSYNGNIRKQFAGVGFMYDEDADVFICPQPFPSWTLDLNYDWQPPMAQPEGIISVWDEASLSWKRAEVDIP